MGFCKWEVLEHVRLNSELVVLSACDTAIGRAGGGEGLLTLARAFHFAGARSVLATLWRVDDRASARLMKRLYEHLRAGASKTEARRSAQLTFIGDPAVADPTYWAAFTLSGE
jgi:CHAT domain-containing protein